MAASSDRARTVAKAISFARGANIWDADDSESIRELINDYFTNPGGEELVDTDEEHQSGDEDTSVERTHSENSESVDSGVDNFEATVTSVSSDSEVDDEALVQPVYPPLDIDIVEIDQLRPDTEKLKIQA